MDAKTILKLTGLYEEQLQRRHVSSRPCDTDALLCDAAMALGHARAMLADINEYVHEGHFEDASLALNQVQIMLWVNGWYTLDELNAHKQHERSAQTNQVVYTN